MPKQPDDAEKEAAKEALEEAIREAGEGKEGPTGRPSYYEEFGTRMFEPDPRTFGYWWHKSAFTYVMRAMNDPQIAAYYRNGEIVLTHTGHDRHKLGLRGWW